MPYRLDARSPAWLEERVARLSRERSDLERLCRSAAEALRVLIEGLEPRQRELDEAVARALDAERRAIRGSLATRSDRPPPGVGDRLRTQGALAALQRARARVGQPKASDAVGPPPDLAEARRALREARRARAELAAEHGEALARARSELTTLIEQHDALADAIDEAERQLALREPDR
ncbi:MAG: hypothetical protein AB7S26_27845 [Sandaracinaceae bacterium]